MLILLAALALAHPKPAAPAAPKAAHRIQSAAVSPEKDRAIRRLMAVMGIEKLEVQAIDLMLNEMKSSPPYNVVPDAFWTKFRQKVDVKELLDMIVPIYARHFTTQDIKDLTAWYQSPLGQKFVASQPAIMRESMDAGVAWGRKIGEKAAQEIEAEGIKLEKQ
jgi:hypothetical protein